MTRGERAATLVRVIYIDGSALCRFLPGVRHSDEWAVWAAEHASNLVTTQLGFTELRQAAELYPRAWLDEVQEIVESVRSSVSAVRFSDDTVELSSHATAVLKPFAALHIGAAVSNDDINAIATYDPTLAHVGEIYELKVISPGLEDNWHHRFSGPPEGWKAVELGAPYDPGAEFELAPEVAVVAESESEVPEALVVTGEAVDGETPDKPELEVVERPDGVPLTGSDRETVVVGSGGSESLVDEDSGLEPPEADPAAETELDRALREAEAAAAAVGDSSTDDVGDHGNEFELGDTEAPEFESLASGEEEIATPAADAGSNESAADDTSSDPGVSEEVGSHGLAEVKVEPSAPAVSGPEWEVGKARSREEVIASIGVYAPRVQAWGEDAQAGPSVRHVEASEPVEGVTAFAGGPGETDEVEAPAAPPAPYAIDSQDQEIFSSGALTPGFVEPPDEAPAAAVSPGYDESVPALEPTSAEQASRPPAMPIHWNLDLDEPENYHPPTFETDDASPLPGATREPTPTRYSDSGPILGESIIVPGLEPEAIDPALPVALDAGLTSLPEAPKPKKRGGRLGRKEKKPKASKRSGKRRAVADPVQTDASTETGGWDLDDVVDLGKG